MQQSLDYEKLNASYKTREITLSDDYFQSYSNQGLEAKPSSSNNRIYVPTLILEERISELETNLKTKYKSFDDERDRYLKKIKDLEQQVSDKSIQNVCQKVLSSNVVNSSSVSTISTSEQKFDNLMNSDDYSNEKDDQSKFTNKSKDSRISKSKGKEPMVVLVKVFKGE